MALYLQMDGVDDRLSSPSVSFNEIEMEFTPEVIDNFDKYISIGSEFFQRNGSLQESWSAIVQSVYKNGVAQTINTGFITANTKVIVKIVTTAQTSKVIDFLNNQGLSGRLKGRIHYIKIFNSATLVAHYDMTTGTVNDQSGNARHGTLTGGTWLDDGTGGDTGTDGSITLGLTQQIYSDSSVNLSLTQSIYADISANLDLIQNIYRDTETLLGINQTIYKDDTAVLPLTQAIYQDSESGLNLRQEIYTEAESILNLIQEFYEDSQTYITLQLIQQIYKDDSADLSLTQQVYQDSEIAFPLRQEIYAEKETNINLTQNVYKDDISVLGLSQTIYKDSFSSLNLAQHMYIEGEINLPLLIQIRDDLLNLIGTIRLIGKRVLNVNLQGQRIINVTLKGGIDVTAINQNFSMYAGDTKNLVVTMPEDLTGCTVKWGLRQRQYSTENILNKSTIDGITISVTDITIKLAPVDTLALAGTYFQECEVTDQQGNVSTIFTGMVTISKSGV